MRKLLKNKTAYKAVTAAVTVFVIVAVIAINLILMGLQRENNFFVDLTTEQLYTMTDAMSEEMDKVTGNVVITFCDDVDRLLENDEMRPLYILAKNLEKEKDNIKVKTLSLERDPNAVDAYKTAAVAEIESDYVIVECDKKFRLATAGSFWTLDEEGNEHHSFQGEYKLASMILSVTRVEAPVAYFTKGHGETYYDEKNPLHPDNADLLPFCEILMDIGMQVKSLDLSSVSAIPDDCALLIINGPTRDFTEGVDLESLYAVSDIEKIDRYLAARGSVFFLRAKDSEVSMSEDLPLFSDYLVQWGIAYRDDFVKDESDGRKSDTFSGVYATEETAAVAHSLYSMISDLSAAPRTVIADTSSMYCPWKTGENQFITDKVERHASPLLFAPESARSYERGTDRVLTDGSTPVAMVSQTAYFAEEGYYTYSYFIASGTTDLIDARFVGSNAYGNRDILRVALYFVTRTESHADSSLGSPTDLNSENYRGTVIESDGMVENNTYIFRTPDGDRYLTTEKSVSYNEAYKLIGTLVPLSASDTVFISILVFSVALLCVPLVGIYICVRRKYL